MATRTSTRSTKAVKFVDSAEDDEEEFPQSSSIRIKNEPKKSKPRGRPRRHRTSDDEDWDAQHEQSENDDDDPAVDDDDEEEEDIVEDVTKKFKTSIVNRSVDSVYDFG
jgi:hypothetical protein